MIKNIHVGVVLCLLLYVLSGCSQAPHEESEPLGSATSTVTVGTGFTDQTVVTGITNPTTMAFAPDGRLFVSQQGGSLRVVKNDVLLATPFLTVTVSSSGERGLLGVAFDPAFTSNQFVYVYYTATTPAIHNRVSRFTANGDVAVAGSETVLLDLDNLSGATNHNGGGLHFGPDGKLYISVGENANGANAQTLTNLLGKILRINSDGTIPSDNPFFTTASGKNRAIWAYGLRNPFTFDFRRSTGRMFIDDVGEATWEEIDDGIAGSNYGWPTTEGMTTNPSFRSPLFVYGHGATSTTGCAIAGGAFYDPLTVQFPSSYVGKYFFADFCQGWIRLFDPATGTASDFASGALSPVDLRVGPDGSLYYLTQGNGGAVGRIRFAQNQVPTITTQPANQSVSAGQSVTFSAVVSGSQPITFQWQRGGVNIAGATGPSYTFTTALADNGAQFRLVATNAFGSAISNAAVLTVTANQPPTATITLPAAGTTYAAGDTIQYAGTASDPEDGALPGARFTWQVDFHHDTHLHPFIPATTGATGGSFVIPTQGEVSANVFYRIILVVRDSAGATVTVTRDILPRTATISLATNPPGLQLALDGQPVTPPFSVLSVVGMQRALSAPSPQVVAGTVYVFSSWSDGGAADHTIASPAANTTYTATFVAQSQFSAKVNFQPANAPTVPGYLVDSGLPLGDRGNGFRYGWNGDNTGQTRDRNASNSPDQRYDTLIHLQKPEFPNAVWQLQVPNGMYSVFVVSGDATVFDEFLQTTVEGVTVVNGAPTDSARWVSGTATVTVSDGMLTVTSGAGAVNNKICFIEVTSLGAGQTALGFATNPPGLTVTFDGSPFIGPSTTTSVSGTTHTLAASSPQVVNGTTYVFSSWSDGGAISHQITTPSAGATYTATFVVQGAFAVKINFQPAASPTFAGYVVDSGLPFGNRGNGFQYGWSGDNTGQTRDRNASNSMDQRYDTLIHLQKPEFPNASWQLAVPNGRYTVHAVAGDATAFDSFFQTDVEGVRIVNAAPTSTERWVGGTVTVTVSDGMLTVANGPGASNNKLCFIEVTAAP